MPNDPTKPAPTPTDDRQRLWRDSSSEVESGLDVIEVHVDVVRPPEPVPLKEEAVLERRSNRAGVRVKYNRGQWRESFEDQLSLMRPHLTRRVLVAMSHVAWTEDGMKGRDPVKTAKAWSAELDKAN